MVFCQRALGDSVNSFHVNLVFGGVVIPVVFLGVFCYLLVVFYVGLLDVARLLKLLKIIYLGVFRGFCYSG